MMALLAWAAPALTASTMLMLLVLAIRGPVQRRLGPGLAYMLWALPGLRLIMPQWSLPATDGLIAAGPVADGMSVLFAGPHLGTALAGGGEASSLAAMALLLWLGGGAGLLALFAIRHFRFCRRLLEDAVPLDRIGSVNLVLADVDGPLAFGVFRRTIAVPRAFMQHYSPRERELVLAHEYAHHARGDLLANWASLIVLALHWWNPVAWIAIRAFREDQELAADAHALAGRPVDDRPVYAHALVRAAGIHLPPACNLHSRAGLKRRLGFLARRQGAGRRHLAGGLALALLGSAALGVSAATMAGQGAGGQVVTIGVKPDGTGGYALLIDGQSVAADAPLPGGKSLPADFSPAGGCDLGPAAQPFAMVIKGMGPTRSYSVMCASPGPTPVPATLAEGLASLKLMRVSVASQPTSSEFPETERTHALGVIDHSIAEVEATLAALNLPAASTGQ